MKCLGLRIYRNILVSSEILSADEHYGLSSLTYITSRLIRAILAGDEESFWAAEAGERKAAGVPPYGRMAGIILSSTNAQEVFDLGTDMARRDGPLRRIGAQVFGPAPAPIARVRGRHRVRLLVKADKAAPLQQALAEWAGQFKLKGELRMAIDIDPQSFY